MDKTIINKNCRNKFFIPKLPLFFMSLNIAEKKPIVVEILKNNGPSLPGKIAREIKLSVLFTSALLSEMVSDKTIKFSFLKVGSSPLYYLPGQEQMLENFVNHLHNKEKEVFLLLKEKQILFEDELEPVQRVCLSNMKDFAVPIKITSGNQEKIFWRFYSLLEEESFKKAREFLSKIPQIPQTKEPDKRLTDYEKPDEIQETIKKLKEEHAIKPIKEKIEKPTKKEVKVEEQKILHQEILKKKVRKRSPTKRKRDFINKVIDYVNEKEIKIIKNFEDENKVCIAQMDSKLGLMHFLVFVLNKKSLNESDLSLAFTEGQHEKLPVLLITNGKLTKKAEEYQKRLGNLLIVHKI